MFILGQPEWIHLPMTLRKLEEPAITGYAGEVKNT